MVRACGENKSMFQDVPITSRNKCLRQQRAGLKTHASLFQPYCTKLLVLIGCPEPSAARETRAALRWAPPAQHSP